MCGCEVSKDSWQAVRYTKKERKSVALGEQQQKQRTIVVVGRYIFLPENIKVTRFKIHGSYNRCSFATVSAGTTFRAEPRVKVIVGDLERVRGRLTWQQGFGE